MKIISAAIAHQGSLYKGDSHAEIGIKMVREGFCKRPYPSGPSQGFITDEGNFVSREDALQIALAAGQVEWGMTVHKTQLFSEDLRYSLNSK